MSTTADAPPEVMVNEILGMLNEVQKELEAAVEAHKNLGRRRDDLFDIALNVCHVHPMTLTKLLGLNPGTIYQAKKRIEKRKANGTHRNSEASEPVSL